MVVIGGGTQGLRPRGRKTALGRNSPSQKPVGVGAGVVDCETAEHLGAQRYKVSIVEIQGKIASGLSTTVLPATLASCRKFGFEQYTRHKVLEIAMGHLMYTDKDGRVLKIPCDRVIMVGVCRDVAPISHAKKTACHEANAL